jgi:hypothetical protein
MILTLPNFTFSILQRELEKFKVDGINQRKLCFFTMVFVDFWEAIGLS